MEPGTTRIALLLAGALPLAAPGKPFKIIAVSKGDVTTHQLQSGPLTLGITDNGGGMINRISMPGVGDIMGAATDSYGRGGQVAIRDASHGGRYNPTQAGFNEELGTQGRVARFPGRLVVEPRGMALWHGDGQYDFTRWENIGADPYDDDGAGGDGGDSDRDGLDEENLAGRQETEVHSEFDYYGTYENRMGRHGIATAAIRHYFEIRFIRPPGHCLRQFRAGTPLWNAGSVVADISRQAPAGTHRGTDADMNSMIAVWSLRNDRSKWIPRFLHYRKDDGKWVVATAAQADDGAVEAGDRKVFILADSDRPGEGKALGLYRPDTDINARTITGIEEATGRILYKDDRTDGRSGFRPLVDLQRAPALAKYGFTGRISGMINRTRLNPGVYETFRGEYYILYGTPAEIIAAVAAIDAHLAAEAGKQEQSIGFPAQAPKVLGEPDFHPGASASSGLPITYESSDTSVATVVGGRVRLAGAGTCIITASQAGNSTFRAATEVVQGLTVKPSTNGILDMRKGGEIAVQADPASRRISIRFGARVPAHVEIHDALGNRVYSRSGAASELSIDGKGFGGSGVYHVRANAFSGKILLLP